MAAIDQVIARARMGGEIGFTERKQFKLARTRAIEKMRRFALADPYFYILELIQGAIAGGASTVDIACSDGTVRCSWIGGRLHEHELAQLFDFLFAAKDRLDIAHIRSIALGVNALLLFAPEQIVIESGDGSPNGTARMVIRQGMEQVEVGKAQGSLDGTYLVASGLNRLEVQQKTGRQGDDDGGLEYGTIELRCLSAPVPIVFNGHPMFGWSNQRIPKAYGYKKMIEFDEGDLYGSLGCDLQGGGAASFQILTHGVWVQSYQHELIPNQKIGGIVCFDRLHKTVDHSGFVRDDRFEEMWVRLRPYAEQLVSGKISASLPKITSLGGVAFSIPDLRQLLHELPRVVVMPDGLDKDAPEVARAQAIAKLLDAELLRVPESQRAAVRVLGGRDLLMWQPDLREGTDERFYAQPPRRRSEGPWLLPPRSLESTTGTALAERVLDRVLPRPADPPEGVTLPPKEVEAHEAALERRKQVCQALARAIGETGSITAELLAPTDPGPARGGLLIRLLSTGRVIHEQLRPSAYAGRVLEIELPAASPTALRELGEADRPFGSDVDLDAIARIGDVFVELAAPVLLEQDQRALAGLGVGEIEAGSPAARLALQVLARELLTRLRGLRPGRASAGLSFSLLRSQTSFDPLALPLLATVSGQAPEILRRARDEQQRGMSLRELALLSDATFGLVYGVVPNVPADLDGLDQDRILALDDSLEPILINLLGEHGYVRVDGRDVLARAEIAGREFLVRDVGLGLRSYPDFPVLVEGDDPTALDSDHQAELLDVLVEGLRARVLGEHAGAELEDPRESEEHRRQAVRHLQWIACRQAAIAEWTILEALDLLEFPLFVDLEGRAWSLASIWPLLRKEGLIVHYGHGLGAAELGTLVHAARQGQRRPASTRPSSLAVSAFVYRLLAPLGRVHLAFDFDIDDHEALAGPTRGEQAFLIREDMQIPRALDHALAGLRGVLGIPVQGQGPRRVQVSVREAEGVRVIDLCEQPSWGPVGTLELDRVSASDEAIAWSVGQRDLLRTELHRAGERLLEGLVGRLPALVDDPHLRERACQTLLDYAGEQLTLLGERDDLRVLVSTPLAERILGLPLVDAGGPTPLSVHRMLDHFVRHWSRTFASARTNELPACDWSALLSSDAPAWLRAWLDARLSPERVALPASAASKREAAPSPEPTSSQGRALIPWPPGRPLDLPSLASNLEHWLDRLRPDRFANLPSQHRQVATRIWLLDHELPEGGMIQGGDTRLEIDATRRVVVQALHDPSPRGLAWLLLAVYAYLNQVTRVIGNEHELEFQRRVIAALRSGELALYVPQRR